jgi:hypothetical protein
MDTAASRRIVGNPYLGIISGLPVIQPQLTAGLLEPDKGRTAGSALAPSSINSNFGIHSKNNEYLAC